MEKSKVNESSLEFDMKNMEDKNDTAKLWTELERISVKVHKETSRAYRAQIANRLLFIADNIYYEYEDQWTVEDLKNAVKVILPFVGRDCVWADVGDYNSVEKVDVDTYFGNVSMTNENGKQEDFNNVILLRVKTPRATRLCIVESDGPNRPMIWQRSAQGNEYFVTTRKRLLGLSLLFARIMKQLKISWISWPYRLFCIFYYTASNKGRSKYQQIITRDLLYRYPLRILRTNPVEFSTREKALVRKFYTNKLTRIVKENGYSDYKIPSTARSPKAYYELEQKMMKEGKSQAAEDYRDARLLSDDAENLLLVNTQLLNALEVAIAMTVKIDDEK